MANVIIVGDGPGGLSAALYLAKNGIEVTVYGQDKTAMNFALLKNYLGIEEVLGSELPSTAHDRVSEERRYDVLSPRRCTSPRNFSLAAGGKPHRPQ